MKTRQNIITVILCAIILSSCLKDDEYIPIEVEINNGAMFLQNLESRGDFLNTIEAPGLITPEEVFQNRDKYLILDIRDQASFESGHIPGALLTAHQDLPTVVKNNFAIFEKIVIVSYTGQSACFYNTLLRYLRYDNTFVLQFGMASWHNDFSQPWIDAVSNNFKLKSTERQSIGIDYKHLPESDYEGQDYESVINSRIMNMFNEYFDHRISESLQGNLVVTEFQDIQDPAIIHYGPMAFFSSTKFGIAHPNGAIHFWDKIRFWFRTIRFLQWLPANREIIVYSGSGFLSASVVAYIKILGYNAKSLLFGTSRFMYRGVLSLPDDEFLYFSNSQIKNYSYETGS